MASPNSSFQDLIQSLPDHMPLDGMDPDETVLGKLRLKLEGYELQNMALFLRSFILNQPQPSFGFDLAIDTEDGTYFLYTQDADGIEVDEDAFDDDAALQKFCRARADALEDFAQQINDSPWREHREFRNLVAYLNEASWHRDAVDEAIAAFLRNAGQDGPAFIAHVQASAVEKATPKATGRTGSRRI